MADKDETEKTIAEDLVVTKYKMAGEIVNRKYKYYVFDLGLGHPIWLGGCGGPALARTAAARSHEPCCHVDNGFSDQPEEQDMPRKMPVRDRTTEKFIWMRVNYLSWVGPKFQTRWCLRTAMPCP